jgi:uncharacterized protein YecT (DUF1311 family)
MNNLQIASARTSIPAKFFWRLLLCLLCTTQFLESTSTASQAGKQFNEADAELNKTYQAVLSTLTNPLGRSKFVAAQKAWIQYRDDNVAFYAEHYRQSKGGLFFKTDLTQERTKFLKDLLADPPR